jgi:predicted ATP-grasp superfamily ATP-dependent carboligase
VDLLQDKQSELEALESITDCLPISVSRLPPRWEDLASTLGSHIILKPRTQLLADQLGMKNRIVQDASALSQFYDVHRNALDWFVAQEVVPGCDADIWQCNAVFNAHHELVSAFTFQKLGMSPPHYGVTTMGRSASNPEVVALVKAIGAALQYTGPAGFEFKRDARTGQYKYIEINPRFGMSNIFDTTCGVNTAYRTYLLGCGDHSTRSLSQSDGLVFVDAFSDLYSRIIDDREPWLSVLRRYFELRGIQRVPAYWDRDDMQPALRMIIPRVRLLRRSAARFLRRSLPH